MPIYGYRCRSCAHEFEVTQRMSDPAGAACPDCGGPGTRLFFPAGILFKGSGFYKTDSRAPAPASASSGDGATTDKTDKTDKKPGDGAGKSTPASPDSGSKPAKEATPASTPTPTSQPKGSSAKAASTSD